MRRPPNPRLHHAAGRRHAYRSEAPLARPPSLVPLQGRYFLFSLSQFTIVCLIRLDALYPSGSMDEKHTNGNWEFSFGPCTARFLFFFLKEKEKMGGAMPSHR